MTRQPKFGPLAGVRVLELGALIAGPFAGQLLGDYGAEVIKVESPEAGDVMRRWGTVVAGEGLWWQTIARNKRSLALDLRKPAGQAAIRSLVAQCDIVLENFRPGTLASWGLDYAELEQVNPGVILVHVSGFGQSGPRARDAGFGSIGEAMGGIRFTTGNPELPPTRCGISLGDSLAALYAVIGSLAALHERERTGCGQEVDVAIYEAVAALMESTMTDYEIAGKQRERTGSVLPGVVPSNVYSCADQVGILIAANADGVFRRLCSTLGQPELADDPRFAEHATRGGHGPELDQIIGAWCAERSSSEALAALTEAGVPAGKIYTAADMINDPHYAAREMVLRPPEARGPMTGIVPKFSRTPGQVATVGPKLGEHTREILEELTSLAPEEINELLHGSATQAPA